MINFFKKATPGANNCYLTGGDTNKLFCSKSTAEEDAKKIFTMKCDVSPTARAEVGYDSLDSDSNDETARHDGCEGHRSGVAEVAVGLPVEGC